MPWIAVDKGFFAKYDLDVELIYVAGSQAMQSLLSGTTPIGIQGIEPVFRVNAHGGDTVMILGLVTKPPFSIIVRPEIKDFRELRGKPMGITRYGSSTDMLLRLSLGKMGIQARDRCADFANGRGAADLGRNAVEENLRRAAFIAHPGAGEARRLSRAGGRSGFGSRLPGGGSRDPTRVHQAESRRGARLHQGDRGGHGDIQKRS